MHEKKEIKWFSWNHRTFLILFLTVAWITMPGCRSYLEWSGLPMTETGAEKESRVLRLKSGSILNIRYDSQFLYITFSPDWRFKRQSYIVAHMNLWLDESGRKAKGIGIAHQYGGFPEPEAERKTADDRSFFDEMEKKSRPDFVSDPQYIAKMKAESRKLTVIGKNSGGDIRILPLDGTGGGPRLDLSNEWGGYTYVWRIPFNGGGGKDVFPFRVQTGQRIGVGLEWEPEYLFDPRKDIRREAYHSMGKGGRPMPAGFDEFGFDRFPATRRVWILVTLK